MKTLTKLGLTILLIVFMGISCTKDAVDPTVTTLSVTEITSNTAKSGGNVAGVDIGKITAMGLVWGNSAMPDIGQYLGKTTENVVSLSFSSMMTGLTTKTTYHVRAYATTQTGTFYGEEKQFETLGEIPVVTTSSVIDITTDSAVCGGNVISDGGTSIISRGVCWSKTENPTTADSFTSDGSGTGVFESILTALDANTTYFVRAYATNSLGTAFGDQITFITLGEGPAVSTSPVTEIGTFTATCGGNVTAENGSAVTARGVCWSNQQYPTILNNLTTDGSGLGEFYSYLTGLSPNTLYFVRAYATNGQGTAYGLQTQFETAEMPEYFKLYVPGDYQGWNPALAPNVFDFDFDGVYNGYVFFPAGGTFQFKFTSHPDWEHTNYGVGVNWFELSIDPIANNLVVPGYGGYQLEVDLNTLTWNYGEGVQNWGVIGEWLAWSSDIDLEYDPVVQQLSVYVPDIPAAENQRFKFRANDLWYVNLGAKIPDDGTLVQGGADIPIPQGGNVTFYLRFTTSEPRYEVVFN